jgi:hypothetical protein
MARQSAINKKHVRRRHQGRRFRQRGLAPSCPSSACGLDLQGSCLVRAVFKGRELLLRARSDAKPLPQRLLVKTKALGWCRLAEVLDREIVMGARGRVTEDARRGSGGARTEFPETFGAVGRSAVAPAQESGTGDAA